MSVSLHHGVVSCFAQVKLKRMKRKKSAKTVKETQDRRRRGGGGAYRAWTHVLAQETGEGGRTFFKEAAQQYKNLSEEERAHVKDLGAQATRNHRWGVQAFPLTKRHVQQTIEKHTSDASCEPGRGTVFMAKAGDLRSTLPAPGLERWKRPPLR